MAVGVVSESPVVLSKKSRVRPSGRWPLVPLAPLIVSVVALVAALLIGLVARKNLQLTSDSAAQVASKTLVAAVAQRLSATPPDGRTALLTQVSARSKAEYLLVDSRGIVTTSPGLLGLPAQDLFAYAQRGAGVSESEGRRVAFSGRTLNPPNEHLTLVALVEARSPAEGTSRLTNALVVLTLLMLLVAVGVALVFTGATRGDLRFIRQRIDELADRPPRGKGVNPRASAVPLRSFDQVGTLTSALNALVSRFSEAERGYQSDLVGAAHIDLERSEFLAGLSHELRTPLNAILGFAHLLESESDGPLSLGALEALAMIRAGGEHLKLLIDDILDLSAAETGQLRLTRTVVDVRVLAEAAVREATATIGSRPIALLVSEGPPALAWADGRRVRQVLTNLLSNALKATAQGEIKIRVESDPKAHSVVVFVSDTGRGIDAGVLGVIFEPYRQVGEESVRRGGVGLGLAIARQLVRLHGGSIEVKSELGVGTAFTLRLPDDSHALEVPRHSVVPWSEPLVEGPEPARAVLPSLTSELAATHPPKERP